MSLGSALPQISHNAKNREKRLSTFPREAVFSQNSKPEMQEKEHGLSLLKAQ
jgi:hypothetical protein